MSWNELGPIYRQHLVSLGRAPGTVNRRFWELERFFRFCADQGLAIDQVTEETTRAFHRDLRNVPGRGGRFWSEGVIQSTLRSLQKFFDWALEKRLVLVHPGPEWTLKKPPPPPPRLLTAQEVAALLDAPDSYTPVGVRNQAILELLYSTGIRRRECERLNLNDLDLARGQLTVRRGKGGKFRLVPIGEHLAAVLNHYLAWARPGLRPVPGEPALFVSRDSGTRLGYNSLSALLKRYTSKLGLQATLHSLRHAFASHLLEGGADVRHVLEMLGHARVSTTQRYTHLQPLELIREHRHTHPRGRKR